MVANRWSAKNEIEVKKQIVCSDQPSFGTRLSGENEIIWLNPDCIEGTN